MIEYFILLGIGLAAGTFGAMLGLGGGIIMLPATQNLLHYSPVFSVGTTLFAVVFTSISGAWGHFRSGHVKVKSALYIGAGGFAGVLLGSFVFKQYLSGSLQALNIFLGLFFVLMAVRMGWEGIRSCRHMSDRHTVWENERESVPGLMGLGLFTGLLTGMLGLGGGFILVPGMMWLFAIPPVQAVGTSLLAMLPITLVGGLIKLFHGYVYLIPGIIMGIGTAVGAQVGSRLVDKINAGILKIIFAVIFFAVAGGYF